MSKGKFKNNSVFDNLSREVYGLEKLQLLTKGNCEP